MNPLVLAGDLWHPAAVVREGLRGHGSFDWLEDGGKWNVDMLEGRPLVVLAKANQIHADDTRPWADEAAALALADFVKRGGGLLVVHAGTSGYRDLAEMRALSGGGFVSHPPVCPVTVEPKAGHFLGAGAGAFTEPDEHYFMDFDPSGWDVFLTSRSDHGSQPAGWCRVHGGGRVVVITPGHEPAVWMHPDFQMLLGNCLAWVDPRRTAGGTASGA